MKFLQIPKFIIERDSNGKKIYKYNNKTLLAPLLPEGWNNPSTCNKCRFLTLKQVLSNKFNYVIIPEDNLIVLDADTIEATKELKKYTNEYDYIVSSNNGTAHYYFKTTKYAKETLPLGTRFRIDNIDVLSGTSLVFTPNPYNKTKKVLQGSLKNIRPIPKKLVDTLLYKLNEHQKNYITKQVDDTYRLQEFLGSKIKRAINKYKTAVKKGTKSLKAYDHYLYPIFEVVTPQKYRTYLEPTLHPDLVKDGDGTLYLQALSTKLAQDPSVDWDTFTNFITLLTQELWSSPYPKQRLDAFINSFKKQKFKDGTPVWQYDPNIQEDTLLVRIRNGALAPVFRTIDDEYVLPVGTDGVTIIRSLINLKRLAKTKGVKFFLNGKSISNLKDMHLKYIDLINIENTPKYPTGFQKLTDELWIFNQYKHNYYKQLLFFGKDPELKYPHSLTINRTKHNTIIVKTNFKPIKTIMSIIRNITHDNRQLSKELGEHNPLISKLLIWLAYKLTKLEYSPLVFQLIGRGGTGKSLFFHILSQLSGAGKQTSLHAADRFNSEFENAAFILDDEGRVDFKIRELVKKYSGSPTLTIEKKGKDPYEVENITTILLNTNHRQLLKESLEDRRVVTLLSENGRVIRDNNLMTKIEYELLNFALLLRDISKNTEAMIYAKKLNISSHYWLDASQQDLFQIKEEEKQAELIDRYADTKEYRLANVLAQIVSKPQAQFKVLQQVFGNNFMWYVDKYKKQIIIPIGRKNKKPLEINNLQFKGKKIKNSFISPNVLDKLGLIDTKKYVVRLPDMKAFVRGIVLPLDEFRDLYNIMKVKQKDTFLGFYKNPKKLL